VFVSRIRKDPRVQHRLSFWSASEGLREGAVLNAEPSRPRFWDTGLKPTPPERLVEVVSADILARRPSETFANFEEVMSLRE
jgi:hypothetical protein